jgi:hypothetical protein
MNRVLRRTNKPRKEAAMVRNNNKVALIGLIILFAVSMVIAGGGKPKIEKVTATMRLFSGKETKELIERIPEIFTDALGRAASDFKTDEIAELKQDTNFLKANLKLKELEAPLLKAVFPNAHFYQLWKLDTRPHFPYLIAIIGNKFYHMPSNFNRLLLEHNLEVNDKNIVKLAKAFVVIALEGKEITFLEGKRIKNFKEAKRISKNYQKLMVTDFTYRAYLKIKIDQEIQDWYFGVNPQDTGQFGVVNIGIPAKGEFHLRYNLFQGERKSKGKTWDTGSQIHVDSVFGGVYLERCGDTLRYYLIVSENGVGIHESVRFFFSGFPPDSYNVYIGLTSKNLSYARYFLLQRVDINPDSTGEFIWYPKDSLTGITWVTAGYADTSDPNNSYRPVTQQPYEELTLEKVVKAQFHNDYPDTFTVYFTDQFFQGLNQGANYPATFAGWVKTAAIES